MYSLACSDSFDSSLNFFTSFLPHSTNCCIIIPTQCPSKPYTLVKSSTQGVCLCLVHSIVSLLFILTCSLPYLTLGNPTGKLLLLLQENVPGLFGEEQQGLMQFYVSIDTQSRSTLSLPRVRSSFTLNCRLTYLLTISLPIVLSFSSSFSRTHIHTAHMSSTIFSD
jgi:hypothetical protein